MTASEIYKIEPPYYWKIPWDWVDTIYFPCGHGAQVRVDWLEDPEQNIPTTCHYKELGLCDGKSI